MLYQDLTVIILEKKKKKGGGGPKKKKKIILLRQNLLGSIRSSPEQIQVFVLGAVSNLWEAPEQEAYQPNERLQQKNN